MTWSCDEDSDEDEDFDADEETDEGEDQDDDEGDEGDDDEGDEDEDEGEGDDGDGSDDGSLDFRSSDEESDAAPLAELLNDRAATFDDEIVEVAEAQDPGNNAPDPSFPSQREDVPSILVVDAAAKKSSQVNGRWLDASVGPEALTSEVHEILRASPRGGRGYAIIAQRGFGEVRIGEFASLDAVARLGFRICNDGPFFAALVHHLGDLQALDYAERLTDEGYMGSFASLGDWARELAESGATSFNRPIGAYQQWADVTASAQRRGEILVIEDEGRFHVFRR